MDKKKVYEQLYIVLLSIVTLGLIGLGLWAMGKLALLSFISLIASGFISFLTIKNFDTFKNGADVKTILETMFFVSLVSGAFVWFGNNKGRAIIEGIFIDGRIIRTEYYVENDNGPGGQNKTYYELKPTNVNNKGYVEMIDWILIIISLSIQVVHFSCLNKADILYKKQKFKKKYPNWKGEVPISKD